MSKLSEVYKAKVPSGSRAKAKIATVMREFKKRKLKSSSGSKVKDRRQALAIAFSEARRNG